MSAFLRFEVFGTPQPQGSARAFVVKGRAVVTSANPNLKDWRNLVSVAAREAMAGLPPVDGAVEVNVVFWLARPKSVKRASVTVKPDIDKCLRAVLDSLTSVVFQDDAQVVLVGASKHYCDDEHPTPRAEVSVWTQP